MTVSTTTPKPINLAQLASEAAATDLRAKTVDGSTTILSDTLAQSALDAAVAAHTADPTFGLPNEDKNMAGLRARAQQVFADPANQQFTPAQVQKILAGLVLRATR